MAQWRNGQSYTHEIAEPGEAVPPMKPIHGPDGIQTTSGATIS